MFLSALIFLSGCGDTSPVSYQDDSTSEKTLKSDLRNDYGSRFVSLNYTYARGGIFVELLNGNKIDLHLFDAKTLVDEKILMSYLPVSLVHLQDQLSDSFY